MGKIKLERDIDEYGETVGWLESDDAFEVEVPDAIIKEWREIRGRLDEIDAYFEERVSPQLEAEYARKREEWRRTHLEEAKRDDLTREIWSRAILEQVKNLPDVFGELGTYDNVVLVDQPSVPLFVIPPDKKDEK